MKSSAQNFCSFSFLLRNKPIRFLNFIFIINFQITDNRFRMSILSLPSEMLVEIATHLGTTGNLANFKLTCARIYNAIESEKVNRKKLPHLKVQEIKFSVFGTSTISVDYRQKHEDAYRERFLESLGSTEHKIAHSHPTLDSGRQLPKWNFTAVLFSILPCSNLCRKSTTEMKLSANFTTTIFPVYPNISKPCLSFGTSSRRSVVVSA